MYSSYGVDQTAARSNAGRDGFRYTMQKEDYGADLMIRRKHFITRASGIFVLAVTLASCGGGGSNSGGSSPPPSPPPPPSPNVAPTVNAGGDLTLVEGEQINLGANATDTDGTISSYSWSQISGPIVSLSSTNQSGASFTAPAVSTITNLEFEVTVTDNSNAEAVDSVIAMVNPNEPPELTLHFPCEGCRAYSDALTVTGTVNSGPDNGFVSSIDGIASVLVDAGAGEVSAIVETDGDWIAQNVPLPSMSSVLSISVTAEDLFTETTGASLGLSYEPTLTPFLLTHDPTTPELVYLFEYGNSSTERLFSLDLTSGTFVKIHEELDTFERLSNPIDARIAPDGSSLFVNVAFGDIFSFDLVTSESAVVSGAGVGSGTSFVNPNVMGFDSDDDRLVIYDSDQQFLFLVDTATGDRTIASDNAGTGSGTLFDDPADIAIDSAGNTAYLKEPNSEYMSVDLSTGDRIILPTTGADVGASTRMGFDPTRSQIVVVNAFNDLVFTIDTNTGNIPSTGSDNA